MIRLSYPHNHLKKPLEEQNGCDSIQLSPSILGTILENYAPTALRCNELVKNGNNSVFYYTGVCYVFNEIGLHSKWPIDTRKLPASELPFTAKRVQNYLSNLGFSAFTGIRATDTGWIVDCNRTPLWLDNFFSTPIERGNRF